MQKYIQCAFIHDDRPGHISQLRGLAEALERHGFIETHFFAAPTALPPAKEMDMVVCCGSATQESALALANYWRCQSVCLMNPGTFKRKRFHLCLIPEHDGIKNSDHVWQTKGAMNPVLPAENANIANTLVLLGGPSRHYKWDKQDIYEQLKKICHDDIFAKIFMTNSRRTPSDMHPHILSLCNQFKNKLHFTDHIDTPKGWINEQLQQCGSCWVSEDSISMVYESLSAGAKTYLLNVPTKRNSRITRALKREVDNQLLITYEQWENHSSTHKPHPPLQEASRMAHRILKMWFPNAIRNS